MSVSKQLSKFLETNDISLKDLSVKTGLPIRTLQSYVQNTRQPTTPVLTILAEKAHININWLLTGLGDMFSTDTTPTGQTLVSLSSDEFKLITACRNASQKNPAFVKKVSMIVELIQDPNP